MFHHIFILIQFRKLRSLNPQIRCFDKYHRVRTIKYSHFRRTISRYIEYLFFLTGREQLSCLGTSRVLKIHIDAGTRSRNALNYLVAVYHRMTVLNADMFLDDLVGVRI